MVKIVWASIKYHFRELSSRIGLCLSRLYFWQWKKFKLALSEGSATTVRYVGRAKQLPVLKTLLGRNVTEIHASKLEAEDASPFNTDNNVVVYEVPFPGSIRIPHCLSTVVRLNRSVEDILANYSKSLRRSISKRLADFHYETLTDVSQLEMVNEKMLIPYAVARNGADAHHLTIQQIKDMAFSHYGRLDLLYEKSELVGCHLGHSFLRKGKRYWQVNRFGFTEQVFSDYKRYQDVNSLNLHLALLSAIENDYDYCDYGMSLASPGTGLIEWKRRRKGFLTKADGNCFHLRAPKHGAAQFFWDTPLFALEGKNVTLHLGIPEGKTDEEVIEHHKEMGYDGIQKVYLKAAKPASQVVIEALESRYAGFMTAPKIIVSKVS